MSKFYVHVSSDEIKVSEYEDIGTGFMRASSHDSFKDAKREAVRQNQNMTSNYKARLEKLENNLDKIRRLTDSEKADIEDRASERLKKLGLVLTKYRKNANISQTKLSRYVGVSRETIRQMEVGRNTTLEKMSRYIRLLGTFLTERQCIEMKKETFNILLAE